MVIFQFAIVSLPDANGYKLYIHITSYSSSILHENKKEGLVCWKTRR